MGQSLKKTIQGEEEKNAKTIPVVDNYDDEETRLNRSIN